MENSPAGQFRFGYFTDRYEETVAFYRDGLGWPVVHAWDRSASDKGTLIGAAAGLIEVLAKPNGESDHLFEPRPPQGAFMVVEVHDVDAWYAHAVAQALPLQQALTDQAWGHRSFCLREPNGLTLYLFSSSS